MDTNVPVRGNFMGQSPASMKVGWYNFWPITVSAEYGAVTLPYELFSKMGITMADEITRKFVYSQQTMNT